MEQVQLRRRIERSGRGGRRRGVSMVELMVAISVLLLTVAGTVSSQIASSRLLDTSAGTSAAMADLQACMEQLTLNAPVDIPVAGSPYEAGQPVAAFEGLHLDGERIVPNYPGYALGGVVPDPLEIVLTITWNDHQGRARSLQLATMKTQ